MRISKQYIIYVVIVAFAFAGCSKKEAEETKEVTKTVSVSPVTRTDVVRTITLTGTVKPIEDSIISAEVAGSIVEKSVKLGEFVEKNKILAKIDEENYRKAFQQTEAILKVAEASMEQSKATQKQLQEDQATNERLYQQNVIAKKVLDDINTRLAEVNAMVKVSEAKVKEAELARDVAKINLDKATVKCPLEKAYVADVNFDIGNYVMPGNPLVRLVNIDQIWVEVGVGEKQINEVEKRIAEAKAQDKDKKAYATFTVPTMGNKEYTGSIEEISPYADPATGSFILRMRCDNATHELKGGMFALAVLSLGTRPNSLVVPQSAVVKDGSIFYVFIVNSTTARKMEFKIGFYVFIFNSTTARKAEVKIGASQNEQIEIVEGLIGSETIVVDGADMLADGDIINPLNPKLQNATKGESAFAEESAK